MKAIDVFKNFQKTPIRVFSTQIQKKLCNPDERRVFLASVSEEDRKTYQDNALRSNLINGVLNVVQHKNIFNIFVPSNLNKIFNDLWERLGSYQHLPLTEKIDYVFKVKDLSSQIIRANS